MPKSSQPQRKKPRSSKKAKVRLLSSRTVYRGPVFTITTDHVQEPGGIRVRRDLIHHSGSVVILAVDESGDQSGSTPRVLLEETGYTAARWRRILKFYASPGFMAETMSVFLATGLRAGIAQPEADEIIYKRLVPLPTAVRMVTSGTIRDGKTISGVLWLQHRIADGKEGPMPL